jgi:hypothetical protein
LDIQDGILKIIDLSKRGLKKIEHANDETDTPEKDFLFEGVNLRTSDVDFSEEAEMSDSN